MDELEAAEASSNSTPATPASKAISVEEAVEEHATVGVVTEAERVVETTPVVVTSSGGTAQAGPSGSSNHVDPSLLDSSPSTRQYVRKARRRSIMSTDSERTGSATVRVSTPPSPLPESGGIASTPIIILLLCLLQQSFRKVRLQQQLLGKFLVVRRFLGTFLRSQKAVLFLLC